MHRRLLPVRTAKMGMARPPHKVPASWQGASLPKSTRHRQQHHGSDGCNHDGWKVEAFLVAETQQAGEDEAAHECADYADDEVGEETVISAGDAFGKPPGDDTNDDPRNDAHEALASIRFVLNS